MTGCSLREVRDHVRLSDHLPVAVVFLLLLVIPPLWWFSFRGLAPLGPYRRIFALALRSLLLLLITVALTEVQMVRISNRLAVLYLLDQSLSIPVPQRQAMIRYVNDEIRQHRQNDDLAGVIVFGRDAAIEIPPFDDDVQLTPLIEPARPGLHEPLGRDPPGPSLFRGCRQADCRRQRWKREPRRRLKQAQGLAKEASGSTSSRSGMSAGAKCFSNG